MAAADAAALLGGELTFADPSDAVIKALDAVGLGDAITLARRCGQRALPAPPPVQSYGAIRRAPMAQHPAGTGRYREHSRYLLTRHEEPTTTPT